MGAGTGRGRAIAARPPHNCRMKKPLPQPVAPSIDDPVELLLACHGQIRRFAGLAQRLRGHVQARGADGEAREAAAAVLRYFDLAAVLHHEDEDIDLFPALREAGDAALRARIDALQAQHAELARLWGAVRPWLVEVAAGRLHPIPGEVDAFADAYRAHADREESEVYPHAPLLDAARLRAISASMVRRRMAP